MASWEEEGKAGRVQKDSLENLNFPPASVESSHTGEFNSSRLNIQPEGGNPRREVRIVKRQASPCPFT
jgi:hypothetical protein